MSILNFVNQDQLDELDEDPRLAFMQLVNHAQRSLHEQTKDLNEEEQSEWRMIEDLRLSFMNVVLAAAKQFEIEPFYSMEVPRHSNFDMRQYTQFKFDLDHYVTQLVLNNSLRSRSATVEILPKSKEAIRTYIHNLRECIERANMDSKKRTALLKRLDALEEELEKRRISMTTVALAAFAIWAIPGDAWDSYEIVSKLISNVMRSVGEAKELEDSQRQLPQGQVPKALSPPRKVEAATASTGFASDLDDDIPF